MNKEVVITPRMNSLVKHVDSAVTWLQENDAYHKYISDYLFLGEIPNQQGHCVAYNLNEKEIMVGLHTEDFVELTEDAL